MILKIFLTITLPMGLIYTIFSRTWSEIKTIPFYIKSDLAADIESYKNIMRS